MDFFWLMVGGWWLVVVGCWLMVGGCWLLGDGIRMTYCILLLKFFSVFGNKSLEKASNSYHNQNQKIMRYVLAFFLPWLSLLLQGKILSGFVCLLLQLTIIGWVPAFLWAFTALNRMYADRRTNRIIREMRRA